MFADAKTDVGLVRSQNQDYYYGSVTPVGNFDNLFLVADGMGGHQAGDKASRLAVECFVACIKDAPDDNPVRAFSDTLIAVNHRVIEVGKDNPALEGMGTTLVACTIKDDTAYILNVGDSRLYLFHEGCLKQVTRDHSLVEELVEKGEIERGSEIYLRKKNIVTRAIGLQDPVKPDLFDVEVGLGDMILMCTDGLSGMVSDEEIAYILSDNMSLTDKVNTLIEAALANGGRDNIAVVLVEV